MPALAAARRALPRLALGGVLLAGSLALAGCEQVGVITSAAPASFDQRVGNNPLAAADAASLQNALRLRGQVWSLKLFTQPVAAGDVDVTSPRAVTAGRGKMTVLDMVLTSEAQSTTQGFSSRGAAGEQGYIEGILQAIANAGYTRITSARVDVYFGSSHHAVLSFNGTTGFVYKVLDGKP